MSKAQELLSQRLKKEDPPEPFIIQLCVTCFLIGVVCGVLLSLGAWALRVLGA